MLILLTAVAFVFQAAAMEGFLPRFRHFPPKMLTVRELIAKDPKGVCPSLWLVVKHIHSLQYCLPLNEFLKHKVVNPRSSFPSGEVPLFDMARVKRQPMMVGRQRNMSCISNVFSVLEIPVPSPIAMVLWTAKRKWILFWYSGYLKTHWRTVLPQREEPLIIGLDPG